ncbi:hypothetical protein ACIHFE_13405 [Streptomyces sp. NPDC052396]|uniref:hypothetical protein n=1 Tax=Streptomyces sp. NPDC052396 TaxID=3365689 RepID=UPI0037D4F1F1
MVIATRVVIVALTVGTVFLVSWVPVLRVAILRRRPRDWALFWAVLVLSLACLASLESRLSKTVWPHIGMATDICLGCAAIAYYLWFDIRHHRPPVRKTGMAHPAGPLPGHPAVPGPAGYPPYGQAGAAQPPQPMPAQPPHLQPPQQAPVFYSATPAPQQAPYPPRPPQRIDQVRAELDELSHLLRKEPRDNRDREQGR